MDSDNLFFKLIEWIWLPVMALILQLHTRISALGNALGKTLGIVQTKQAHHELLRTEDLHRNVREFEELKQKIDKHNEIMLAELRELRHELKNR